MITGKTLSGFEFEIEEDVLDDYDLLQALVRVDKGEVSGIFDIVRSLLGKAQEERLKDHVRKPSGRVSAKGMTAAVGEIFKACNEIKNS